MSERERAVRLIQEAWTEASHGPTVNLHWIRMKCREALDLLREQEREPDAWAVDIREGEYVSSAAGGVYIYPTQHHAEQGAAKQQHLGFPKARATPVYFGTPPTSTSEGDEGSFGGVSLLNSLVRLGRGALEMEFGLTENGDVGVWWTRGIEDAPDAVGDTVDEALYRLLAPPPETESED